MAVGIKIELGVRVLMKLMLRVVLFFLYEDYKTNKRNQNQ